MRKNFKENFNFMTNIFILILLFLSGLSYADTNGIWQFANDTQPGIFGFDEGAGVTNNYTFINPVYFNLGLHSTVLSTFTDLRANLFNANSATIATQLTLTGFNCNVNSKLRTDGLGNVICSADNVNGGVYNLATMKTAVVNDFHNLGGVDLVNDGVYNLATMKTAVSNDFHTLGGFDNVNDGVYNLATMKTAVSNNFHNLGGVETDPTVLNSVKNGVSWAEVSGKPTPKTCPAQQYISSINFWAGTIGCTALAQGPVGPRGATGAAGVTPDLVNGLHSSTQCSTLGGSVITSGGAKFCRFNGQSCKGFAPYLNWATYDWNVGFACNTVPRSWRNAPPPTCSTANYGVETSTSITQIGCY